MKRRDFLARVAARVAAGVAADQIELLERLTHSRTLFAGWRAPTLGSAVKLLNGFRNEYHVPGVAWRSDRAGFEHGAMLTKREIRYDLTRDVYVVSATDTPFLFRPGALVRPDASAGAFGPICA